MTASVLPQLLNNAALLLAVAVLYAAIGFRPKEQRGALRQTGVGVLLGGLGVLVMLNAWEFRPGIVFDTRSVVLGLSGLFFGLIPSAVAVVMTGAYRIWLGGAGTAMGVAVIVTSVLVGLVWRAVRSKKLEQGSLIELYLFGLVVHAVMLICAALLPEGGWGAFLDSVGIPVMAIYPVATALLGWVMLAWGERARRVQTAEQLRASEERYRRLFQNALSGHYISTPAGRLVDCNPMFLEIFGFPSLEAALATPIQDLFEAPSNRADFVERVRTEGRVGATELVYQRRDGTEVHVLESAVGVLGDDGSLSEIVGFIVDISERAALESQLIQAQKLEAMGRLAGGVAHDFNNNLAVILGHAELARSELDEAHPVQPALTIIQQAGERSAELTRQLLAFSRKQPARPAIVDLREEVEGARTMLERVLGEEIRLVTEHADDLWMVRIDPGQVDQVLMNLVINARDAIAATGEIRIETANVTVPPKDRAAADDFTAGDYVTLSVTDTGHGIPEDVLSQIFDPFFTTKPEGQGTGLGLSTLYGIVRQNGGWVDVLSEPGAGARFTVYLKRAEGTPTVRPESGDRGDFSGTETILIAEDEAPVLSLSKKILERQGYTVLAALAPGEAISLAEAHDGDIHLLLTDVVMPDMNGGQLKERIERIRPGIRTLFASGYPDEVITSSGLLEEGANFLQKPFTVRGLAERVRNVLDA